MLAEETTFCSPATVEEASAELADDGAVALNGGTSIGLLLGQGLLQPSKLVWLGRIPELKGVAEVGGELVVGASTTLRQLARHPVVDSRMRALAVAASSVGNTRVRAVATVGGALAHADPRQDLPPALLALGATVGLAGPGGRRRVPAHELFTGFMETCLAPDELIVHVSVPITEDQRSAYFRYTPGSEADWPTVSVAASTVGEPGGTVLSATVALGGLGPTPLLVPEAGSLVGGPGGPSQIDVVARAAAERAEPVEDRLGSAAYKRSMAVVWTRRALEACLSSGPGA